jgi:predicted RNA-binding protein with PUA-like domain
MTAYWLLLADPESYGFDDLLRDGSTVWDGIAGANAQANLRKFKEGDQALVYHTSPQKAVVGKARVTSAAFPDPSDAGGKRVTVNLEAAGALKTPVALTALRENPKLSGMVFLKIQRIAVSPLTRDEFNEIIKMGRAG